MDKLYKPIFLAQLKSRMAAQLPDFAPYKIPKLDPLRKWFTSSSLYRKVQPSGKCLWIDWSPSEGVERAFFVLLGWSQSSEELPYFSGPKDIHYYSLSGPSPGFETASVNIQKLEGRNAIADFRIPTPWDQVLDLGPVPPEAKLKAAMAKAFAEYHAVTPGEREAAVLVAMNEAMAVLKMVLPDANRKLEEMESK
jgi:hypothetical protein